MRRSIYVICIYFTSLCPLLVHSQDAPGHQFIADRGTDPRDGDGFFSISAPWAVTDAGAAVFDTDDQGILDLLTYFEHALWMGDGGPLQNLVQFGGAVPGGGVFREIDTPISNSKSMFTTTGYGVFLATYRLPPDTDDIESLFLATPSGQLHNLAYYGQGADGGGTFGSSAIGGGFIQSYVISPGGQVVFACHTTGGQTFGLYHARLVSGIPVVTRVVLHNDPAPGGLGNFNFTSSDKPTAAIDDSGRVFFRARTTGSSSNLFYWDGSTTSLVASSQYADKFTMNNSAQCVFTTSNALLLATPGGTQNLLPPGTALPGGGTSGNFTGKAVINEAGDVVFSDSSKGIFKWSAGTVTAVALNGQTAPSGGTYSQLSLSKPLLTNSGMVIFKTEISGQDQIILSYQGEAVTLVAEGDRVDGRIIDSIAFHNDRHEPTSFAAQGPVNDAGQVAYTAQLKSSAAGRVDRTSVYIYTSPARWWAGGSGDWDTSTNWRFNFFPTPQRDIVLDPSVSVTVTGPAASASVRLLQIGGGNGITRLELQPATILTAQVRTNVTPNGVLAGLGAVAGPLLMDGTQEIGPETASMSLPSATYTNRSRLAVSIDDHQAQIPGLNVSNLTIENGAQIDLTWNRPGSTTDFSGPEWEEVLRWTLLRTTNRIGSFVIGTETPDSKGATPNAARGTFSITHSATQVDLVWTPMQYPPTVTAPPSQLVALGSTVNLDTTGTGNLLSYKWTRNGATVPGEDSKSLVFPAIQFSQAGNYAVTASNDAGRASSTPLTRLGVVDVDIPATQVAINGTLTLTVQSTAPAGFTFGYQWNYEGAPLLNGPSSSGSLISGVNSKTLRITRMTEAEEGNYTCTVFLESLPLTTNPCPVHVVVKPTVTVNPVPGAMVSAFLSWPLVADEFPTGFVITGLPSGLTYNRASGLITGIPNVSGTFSIKVRARNAAGLGVVQAFTLDIASLPAGTQGDYTLMVARDPLLNQELGGRLSLTVASTGTVSGSLANGRLKHAIRSRVVASLSANPLLSLTIPRKGGTTLKLDLVFDPTQYSVSGTLADTPPGVTVEGRRHVWGGQTALAYAGLYNSGIELPAGSLNDILQPLGAGWQTMTIGAAGNVRGSGRTPDGVAYTFSGTLWPEGSLPQFALLYGGKGSLTGLPQCQLGLAPADHRVGGWVEQNKLAPTSSKDRTYGNGIPQLRREVHGSAWIKPSTAQPMIFGLADAGVGTTNAGISFSKADVESTSQFASLAQFFRINSKNETVMAATSAGNPGKVRVTLNAAKGSFSGSFELSDLVSGKLLYRKAAFSGILLNHRKQGVGYFLLPGQVPTVTTSPILSGNVTLQ